MDYIIVDFNVDPSKDKRPNKAKNKQSVYRDSKSKAHSTTNGKGVVGKLHSK
jgi:hypothetical protein